jgi:probable F420-dependent oxidoreductase
MLFGIGLYPYDDGSPEALLDVARHGEQLGFDGIFAFDHVLRADVSYRDAFLDPHTTLAAVGAATRRLKLGTDIVVLPIRSPVLVAKALATLDFLFPGRVIAGMGVGWNPLEYAATGVPVEERFDRMEEYVHVLRRLLTERTVTFHGKHVHLDEVEIKPFPAGRIPVWIGSGSQTPRPFDEPGKKQAISLTRRGARRIASMDGWIPPSTATHDIHRSDWERIRAEAAALGRDPELLTRVAYDFCFLVDTTSRARALREQEGVFRRFLGYTKTWEYVLAHNLVGTVDDIARRMVDRARATGISWWILHCMVPDLGQVEAWAAELLPRVRAYLDSEPPVQTPDAP